MSFDDDLRARGCEPEKKRSRKFGPKYSKPEILLTDIEPSQALISPLKIHLNLKLANIVPPIPSYPLY